MLKTVIVCAVFAVAIYFLKEYMNGCSYHSDTRLDGKVAIITGANTGIGKETVIDFAQRGAKVYMACRSLERGQEALDDVRGQTGVNKEQLVLMKLDLASLTSVREFVQNFRQQENKLDILVNNAGVMWTPYMETADGFEMTFGTNHLGHFMLTTLLMEPLISAAPSRVVTVSSLAYEVGSMVFDELLDADKYNRVYAYANSKLANVLFTRELARRLEGTGVTSYSLHPGSIITELGRHIPIVNYPVIKDIAYLLLSPIMKDAWHGARTSVFCSVEPGLEKYSGHHFSDCALRDWTKEAKDDDIARRLWEMSVELVKIQPQEIHPSLRR